MLRRSLPRRERTKMASKKKIGRPRVLQGERKDRGVVIPLVIIMEEDEKAKIKEDADKNYRSMSAHVRYIINLYFKESNEKGEN